MDSKMKYSPWTHTQALAIDDVQTRANSYRVLVSATGKWADVPRKNTDIVAGHVIIPVILAQKILGAKAAHAPSADQL